MRVALIVDTWFPQAGGGQINAYEISNILAKKGVKIDIITRNTGPGDVSLSENLKVIKLSGKTNPSSLISKLTFLFQAYYYISKRKYDIVHAHAFLPGITAKAISATRGVPSVFTVHGTSIGTNLNSLFKSWIEKIILTKIAYSAQITVSRDFLKIDNVNKNITYIPNGIKLNNYKNVKALKSRSKTLIFIGRLHPQKNLPNLIEAVKIVKRKIPNIKLIIVGDGEQKELLKNNVIKLNLQNCVSFEGEVKGDKLVKLLKSSQVFILPSVYEGQPLALLEAWASKIPVIASKTGDCPFLIKEGSNGFLIGNLHDPISIAGTITKALMTKNLQKMGVNGYNLVAKNFSWEKSAQMTLKVYENLTKARN